MQGVDLSEVQTGTLSWSPLLPVSPEMAMLQSADRPACCTGTVLCLRMAERTRRQPSPLSTREQRSSAQGKGGRGGWVGRMEGYEGREDVRRECCPNST